MKWNREQYGQYLKTSEWAAKRSAALGRAGFRCQVCNSPRELQVHHRTYARVGAEDPMDLTVLCGACHRRFHRRRRSPKKTRDGRVAPKAVKVSWMQDIHGELDSEFDARLARE